MTEFAPVILVTVYKARAPRWRGKARRQPWRWNAKSEGNREILASGEPYANREDAVAAVHLLFGEGSTAYLLRREQDNWPVNQPLGYENLRYGR